MRHITKFYREIHAVRIKMSFLIAFIALLLFPNFQKIEHTGNNMYSIHVNGKEVGLVQSQDLAKSCLREARRQVVVENADLVFVEALLSVEGKEVMFGKIDSREKVIDNMKAVLQADKQAGRNLSYMVKINEFTLNIRNVDGVKKVLQAALNKYDTNGDFQVELITDPNRELNVLTTKITSSIDREKAATAMPAAGIDKEFDEIDRNSKVVLQSTFEDFDNGMVDLYFDDEIEVIEAYLPESDIVDVATATEIVTRDQEKNSVYEVKTGDTLSEIAMNVDIPLDKIIAMNENLMDENSSIRVGQQITITIPEPVLSLGRRVEITGEEDYDAPIEYVYNDSWYTNQTEVKRQPSTGHRRFAAVQTFHNNELKDTEIVKEVVTISPVAKQVEKGTKALPTYIKPISGGRLTSNFGRRTAPKKGASTYHKGIDWATPVGTSVVASSDGVVARAGWGRGYGYVVYINHSDGRQTRYGHLSKVLVTEGQKVSQGQRIALSGNTGVSTGPHIHFEILVNGTAVNPFSLMN